MCYSVDSFPFVKRKDKAKFNGDYRTRRTILETYDALAQSMLTGHRYQTRLDPPPTDSACCQIPEGQSSDAETVKVIRRNEPH